MPDETSQYPVVHLVKPGPSTLLGELRGRLASEGFGLKKREVAVMTRLSVDTVEIIDALVELEIFKSRSEAVAALVERGMAGREELFRRIKVQADEIRRKREAARVLAMKAIHARSSPEEDAEESGDISGCRVDGGDTGRGTAEKSEDE